ncbi:MAG: DUF1667 domain-containing protein [Thermoplasmata archaeon]|nr:DUF1667 domain-containing protein [Thermoplasmata archaeon]
MKEMICIQCPVGCKLIIRKKGEEIYVEGNKCKRGKEYAINELRNPTRILTTTVFIEGGKGKHEMLPVKSDREIPKDLLEHAMKELAGVRVKAPVKCGDIVFKNIANTGVNIIATRDMEEK